MILRSFFILIFIFFSFLCFSHNTEKIIDSLLNELKSAATDTGKINILNNLSYNLFHNREYERALKYAKKGFDLAGKANYPKGKAAYYYNIAVYNNIIGNYDKAIKLHLKSAGIDENIGYKKGIAGNYSAVGIIFEKLGKYDDALEYQLKCLKIRNEIKDKYGIAMTNNNIGIIYDQISDYEKSIDHYYKSLKLFEELSVAEKNSDPSSGKDYLRYGISMCYNNIGIIYVKQKDFDMALDYYFKSLNISEELDDNLGLAINYGNIGDIYQELGEYEKALSYHFRSIKILIETDSKQGLALSYNSIGNVYKKQEDYNKALTYFSKSLNISKPLGNKRELSHSYEGIGSIYYSITEYDKAADYLLKAFGISKEIGSPERISDVSEKLSLLFSEQNQHEKALKYYRLYTLHKNSIKDKRITDIETRYESEKKENEIRLLDAERKIKETELREKTNLLIFVIAALFLVITASVLYILKIRSDRKLAFKNLEIVESENELMKLKSVAEPFLGAKTDNKNISVQDNNDKADKYAGSSLSYLQKQDLADKIVSLMENEKIFKDDNLNLNTVSGLLGTNTAYVSQVINEKFNKNFASFINEYRIKEARRMLSDPANSNFTIEFIAKSLGYNSKTTFNEAFKKYTGITPSFFKKTTNPSKTN